MKRFLLSFLTLFTVSCALYSKTYSSNDLTHHTVDGMNFRQDSDVDYMEIQLYNSLGDTITLKIYGTDGKFNAMSLFRMEFFPKHKFKFWRVNSSNVHPARLFRTFCFDDKEIIIESELSHINLHIMYNSKTLKAKIYITYKYETFYENNFVVKQNPDEYFDKFFNKAVEEGCLKL